MGQIKSKGIGSRTKNDQRDEPDQMRGSKTSKNIIFYSFCIFWEICHFSNNLKKQKSNEIAFWSNVWGALDLPEVILDVKIARSKEKLNFSNRGGLLSGGRGY